MNGVSNKRLFIVIAVLDAILMNLAYLLGFAVKFGTDVPVENIHAFLRLSPWIGIMTVISFWLVGGYDDGVRHPNEVIYNAISGVFLTGIAAMATAFLTGDFDFPRSIFVLGFVFQVCIMCLFRIAVRRQIVRSGTVRRVAVVGNAAQNEALAQKIGSLIGYRFQVTVMLDPAETCEKGVFDEVDIVCVGDSVSGSVKEKVIRTCLGLGKDVYAVPVLYDILLHGAQPDRVDDLMVLHIKGLSIDHERVLAKRVFDIILAFSLLVALAPLMLVISVVVAVTSPGGPLYSQERIGKRGKPFRLLKFRTMMQDAERYTGPVLTWEGDPRITKVGRILRNTRLDELPQLINVLRGDMSFVGPRPERPFFVDEFSERIPDYRYRLKVKPGITGLAQIEGRYSTNPEDKLKYDLYYIRSFSLLLDLHIMLRTLKVMLRPDSARGLAVAEECAPTSDSITSDHNDVS